MDFYQWLTVGILSTLAVFPLAAHSSTDQSGPPKFNVPLTIIKEWLWKGGELTTLGQKDGSAVAQYTWTVKNIEDKISDANYTEDITLSPPFYTDVPGYKFRLSLHVYDGNSSYLGVYLKPMKGLFDDLVPWPFESRYEISSVGPNGTTFATASIDPSTDCSGLFYRPVYSNDGCGPPQYFDIETLLSNKTSYLIDGALNFNLTIYLDD